MSSPMMTRMLGFLASAAWADPPALKSAVEAVSTVRLYFNRLFRFMSFLWFVHCCFVVLIKSSGTGQFRGHFGNWRPAARQILFRLAGLSPNAYWPRTIVYCGI